MSEEAMILGLKKFREPLRDFPQIRLDRIRTFLISRLQPIWTGLPMFTEQQAVALINWVKSPGWPWYYWSNNKQEAMTQFGDKIWTAVRAVLNGDKTVPLFFNLTLKDELRPVEKVEAHKTRVFCASDFVHLLVSKVLFGAQHHALQHSRGQHPMTIGIVLPGPEFVTTVLRLKNNIFEADIGGSDARFPLGPAAVIRDVRKAFLPSEYHEAVDIIYNSTYCGVGVLCGYLLRLFHMKSGCENTIWDTSLLYWGLVFDYCDVTYRGLDMMATFESIIRFIVNGDDQLLGNDIPNFSILDMVRHFAEVGVLLEVKSEFAMGPLEVNYLSHHVRVRYVEGYGDILVAAGNREKLVSSMNFIQRKADMTLEESALAHMLGLRIALWPYRSDFLAVEETADKYVNLLRKEGRWTQRLGLLNNARIPESRIIALHTRLESGLRLGFFPESLDFGWSDILRIVEGESGKLTSPLKFGALQSMAEKKPTEKSHASEKVQNGISKEERKKREAQSLRDREASRIAAKQAEKAMVPANAKLVRKVEKHALGGNGKVALTGGALKIFQAMVDPCENRVYIGAFSNIVTEKLCFGPTRTADLSTGVSAGAEVSAGNLVFLKRRDSLLCSLIYWDKMTTAATVYTAQWYSSSGLTTTKVVSGSLLGAVRPMPVCFKNTSGNSPHGPYLYPGRDDAGGRWIFMSKGETLGVTYAAYGVGTWYMTLEKYQDGADPIQILVALSLAGGGGTSNGSGAAVPSTGYYRLAFACSISSSTDLTITSMQITRPISTSGWSHRAISQVETAWPRVDDFRVVGASLLCTPAPSVLNLAGSVLQLTFPGDTPMVSKLLDTPDNEGESNSMLRKPRDWRKGSYSFVKPGDMEDDLQMIQEVRTDSSGVPTDCSYLIVPRCPFVIHYMYNLPQTATSTYASSVCQVTGGDSINVTSSLAWAGLDEPDTNLADLQAAWDRVKDMKEHMENPLHLADIAKAAKGFLTQAGKIGKVAATVGPLMATLL